MVKVDGVDVVFSKTLILSKSETAVMRPQELMGLGVQLKAKSDPTDLQYSSRRVDETTVEVSFPFVPGNAQYFEVEELARWEGGKFKLRFVGQPPLGDVVAVHVDIYVERNPNYGPR
jgi:hypothetical protein